MARSEQLSTSVTGSRRLYRVDGTPRPVGLIGNPVKHSLSPFFQAAAFTYYKLPHHYQKWEIAREEFAPFLEQALSDDFLGLNVTLPFKQAAWSSAVTRSQEAEVTRAANTLLPDDTGKLWTCHNTDIAGFLAAGLEAGWNPSDAKVLLLGAGGAARAAVYALARAGAAEIVIANRTLARAEQLVNDLSLYFPTTRLLPAPLEPSAWDFSSVPRTLVVNASSQALLEPEAPLLCAPEVMAGRLAGKDTLFYDLVYGETPFLQAALDSGFPALDGLPMLVYQGAISFELWTGLVAPRRQMLAAARAGLSERVRARTTK